MGRTGSSPRPTPERPRRLPFGWACATACLRANGADFVCRTGSYTLSWGAGGSADTYRVERSSSSLFTTPEVFTTTDTSQPMTVTGAKAVTLYHRVRAERSCGSYSPWSAVATVSFQPECAYQPRRHLRR